MCSDHTAWFYNQVIKYHKSLDCPHDELTVALKLSTYIISKRDQVDDDDDNRTDLFDSFQIDLFNFLTNDVGWTACVVT